MTGQTTDILQASLQVERRNGSVRITIPTVFFRKYLEDLKCFNSDPLDINNLVVYFAFPLNNKGLDAICKKIKTGERPYPILVNFGIEKNYYK